MNNTVPVFLVVSLHGCRSVFNADDQRRLCAAMEQYLPYPDFAKTMHIEGIVNMHFSTDNAGNIAVTRTSGNHPALTEYVRGRISMIGMSGAVLKKCFYRMVVNFRLY